VIAFARDTFPRAVALFALGWLALLTLEIVLSAGASS
jgi:hypothetical protein